MKTLSVLFGLALSVNAYATPVTNISAFYRDGQVFVTWDNLITTNVIYTLYRSKNPIEFGSELSSAENLGFVRANSARNQRLSGILGTARYLKIDSLGTPLESTRGLFVATTTITGAFYYAVTTSTAGVEDTTILTGSNSLTTPIVETVALPRPIWQENRTVGSRTYEIYIQFATKVTSSFYPQMTNAGSFPFNFAIIKQGSASVHPVTFWMHPGDGTFLSNNDVSGIGDPNEWIVTLDDWVPNTSDGVTLYYGFHEDYDVFRDANPVPTTGKLHNYTAARMSWTINWCLSNLPLDTTRTYLNGWSLGAIGSLFTSLVMPSKIAAVFLFAPLFEICTPLASNPAGILILERLYGTYQTNLPTNEGLTRNQRLHAGYLASINRLNSLPIIFSFCGKNDANVGWQEKIAFFDSLKSTRHGGFHFWSMTDHVQVFYNSPWQSSFPNFSFFLRYRTNLSYPAFSNCTLNNNPGNGIPSSGDPIGTINGHLDWNDNIVDLANRWEITLKLKDLSTIYGADIAPDSGISDVTLRRLQLFKVPPRSTINWENRRNNIAVQRASFMYDSGLVTIPGVKVYKDSSRLAVWYTAVSVTEQNGVPRQCELAQNFPNPFNPSTTIRYGLPTRSQVTLTVFNTLGQQVARLVDGELEAGYHEVQLDGKNLSSGVYFYRIQAGNFTSIRKSLLMR